jgi:hypothetical protein
VDEVPGVTGSVDTVATCGYAAPVGVAQVTYSDRPDAEVSWVTSPAEFLVMVSLLPYASVIVASPPMLTRPSVNGARPEVADLKA